MAKNLRSFQVSSVHFQSTEKNKSPKFHRAIANPTKPIWQGWQMLSSETLAPREEVVDELMLKLSLLNQLN